MYCYRNGQISLSDFKQLLVAILLRLALGPASFRRGTVSQAKEQPCSSRETPICNISVGYLGYDDEKPSFDPSLMVHFRKQLTPEAFGMINEIIPRNAEEGRAKEGKDDDTSNGTPSEGATAVP